jgi:hypothetical protein
VWGFRGGWIQKFALDGLFLLGLAPSFA